MLTPIVLVTEKELRSESELGRWLVLAYGTGANAARTIPPQTNQSMLAFLGLYGTATVKRHVYFNPCTPREIRRRLGWDRAH